MRPPSWPSFGCTSRCNEVENRMQYITARATANLEGRHSSPSVAMTHGGKMEWAKSASMSFSASLRRDIRSPPQLKAQVSRPEGESHRDSPTQWIAREKETCRRKSDKTCVRRPFASAKKGCNARYSRRRRADSRTKCIVTRLLNVRTAQGVRLSLWSVVARAPFFPSASEGFTVRRACFQPPRPALS